MTKGWRLWPPDTTTWNEPSSSGPRSPGSVKDIASSFSAWQWSSATTMGPLRSMGSRSFQPPSSTAIPLQTFLLR